MPKRINILSSSLDMNAEDLAENLSELYAYCSKQIKEYLEIKSEEKLLEVKGIISGLLEAWDKIDSNTSV